MELVLGAAFLLVARAYAEAAFYVTQKVIDLTNVTKSIFRYLIALMTSALVVLITKFIGVNAVWLLLSALGYGGGAPTLPGGVEIPNFYWFALGLLTFLYAGGIYDWKKVQANKS